MTTEKLRTIRFRPYRWGCGPTFKLQTWTDGRTDSRGCERISYAFSMLEGVNRVELFTGDDFHGSPLHATDSDATMAALMGFLTLRPGDTDQEYFANYTPAQLEFCDQHAEALQIAVMDRLACCDMKNKPRGV